MPQERANGKMSLFLRNSYITQVWLFSYLCYVLQNKKAFLGNEEGRAVFGEGTHVKGRPVVF